MPLPQIEFFNGFDKVSYIVSIKHPQFLHSIFSF